MICLKSQQKVPFDCSDNGARPVHQQALKRLILLLPRRDSEPTSDNMPAQQRPPRYQCNAAGGHLPPKRARIALASGRRAALGKSWPHCGNLCAGADDQYWRALRPWDTKRCDAGTPTGNTRPVIPSRGTIDISPRSKFPGRDRKSIPSPPFAGKLGSGQRRKLNHPD
jgi:hypothetical protein